MGNVIKKVEDAKKEIAAAAQLKPATFKDLIAKAVKKKADKTKVEEIPVTSMGATLTFKKPSDDLIVELLDEMGGETKISAMVPAFKKIIYLSCDMLKDPQLHEDLGITDPFDTVEALFDLSDILEIGEKLMDLLNLSKKETEIKNS